MNLYELLMKRRSVRNYLKQPLSETTIQKLIDVANNAPSGGNIQPISIITVTEKERRQELCAIIGDQPWVKKAPLSMIFCLDFYRIRKWAALLGTDFVGHKAIAHFLIAYADLMCSAQNVVILAEDLGLGSVYIGTIQDNMDRAREYFRIPDYVLPMMVLCIGYPKSKIKTVPKLKPEVITHREHYHTQEDEAILRAYEDKYGSLDDQVENYIQRGFQEIADADQQLHKDRIEKFKKDMNKLEIQNNAQFIFKFKYPPDALLKLNQEIIGAIKNAGFAFF